MIVSALSGIGRSNAGLSSLSKRYVLESHFMDTSTRGAAMLESALPT